MEKSYTLYLDESRAGNYFAISGVIIENSLEETIQTELDNLKRVIWDGDSNATSYILHEMEVSNGQRNSSSLSYYNVFRSNALRTKLYNHLSQIINKNNITTIGTCVDEAELKKLYPGENNKTLNIALQMLLENYCHFLIQNNATGNICYESLMEADNSKLRHRYFEILTLGSLYFTAHCFQTHITGLHFIPKSSNNVGLQLADFIPNTHVRSAAKLPAKHSGFKNVVFSHAYDGTLNNRPKYGLKLIP